MSDIPGLDNMSLEELMALLGGGGSAGPDIREFGGNLYQIDPATGATKLLLEGPGRAGREPGYAVNERTGVVEQMVPGAQMGFAGIDPREKYGNELQQTGFTNQMQMRAQLLNEAENAQRQVMELSQMEERGKMDRAQLGESRSNRAEQGRQANLRAAVDQWQTAMNLIPQMGQLSLQESERVQGILSNGGDFLARAFESRGGTSPLGKVTQADQINALGSTMQTLRGMVQTNMQPIQGEYSDTSADVPAYSAPNMGGGFSGGQMPQMPTAPNFQLSSAPAVSSAPQGAGGGGGLATAAPTANGPSTDWLPTFLQDMQAKAKYANDMAASRPNPNEADYASRDGSRTETEALPSTGRGMGFSSLIPGAAALPYADDIGNLLKQGLTGSFTKKAGLGLGRAIGGLKPSWAPPSREGPYGTAPNSYRGYEQGGYTTEPVFLGNEKGAELFVNPTNAPIQILPADDTRKMGFSKGTTPGYDEGTASFSEFDWRDMTPQQQEQVLAELMPQMAMGVGGVGKAIGNQTMGNMGLPEAPDQLLSLIQKLGSMRAGAELMPDNMMSGMKNAGMGALGRVARMGAIPAYEDGTSGMDPVRELQMLQRMGMEEMGGFSGAAGSLFGGPSGGGMAQMGKGFAQDIPPDLIRKALTEMRMNDIARRIEQGIEMGRKVPGFATGTSYPEFSTNTPPSSGFGNQYLSQSMPQGNSSAGWSLVNGADPYANVGRPGDPIADAQRRKRDDFWKNAPVETYASGFTNEQRTDAMRKYQGLPPLYGGGASGAGAYKPISQKELIEMGRKNLPPGVADVLGGGQARAVTALESQAVPGNFLKTITARQLQGLSPEEIQAMGTMTNTEYNAPLSYVLGRTQAQYGPSQELRRGGFRGVL